MLNSECVMSVREYSRVLSRVEPRATRACKGARSLLQRFIDATTRNEER